MKTRKTLYWGAVASALAALLTACLSTQGTGSAGAGDIGGVVTSPSGPEAGVWVIAETSDLPTKFAKLVVTDDGGRFLIPDLPKANYSVWVRGYGLVDSPKVSGTPGSTLNLTAVPAPSAAAAAEFYPGMYWYSMINIPAKSEFPGTGEKGNGISSNIKSQEQWVDTVKNACQSCHSLGSKGMRTVPKEFGPGVAGWARRTQSGQALTQMALGLGYMGADAALKNYADWTDRIAAGELPHAKPGRPQGVERNMVVTMWDFSTPKYYLHDGISTDRDNPRQCQRPDLRRARGEHRPDSGARSGNAHGLADQAPRSQSQDAILHGLADATFGLLGQGADLGRPLEHSQRDDG